MRAKELRLITFRLGSETFVVDIMAVRQIIPYEGSTSVPTAPSFVEGVVVVRNSVIPIVDLRERLYGRTDEADRQPLLLITHSTAGTIGLKVDEVRRIVNVTSDALLPPPPLIRGVRGDLLIALIPHGEEVLLLLDMESVLTVGEKQQLHSARLSSSSATAGASDR